ncbi:MAG: hypothetical protein J6K32_12240 [Clostridia bacterium]|nr:hypothetical protein [Clostridia bacterium]
MRAHAQRILRDTERSVQRSLRDQNLDASGPHYGAFAQRDGVYQAKSTIWCAASMIACYCHGQSRYHHDEQILSRVMLALDYAERVQHDNGLFDYVTCNFFSAPDTAFCILKIIPHLQYLTAKAERSAGEETVRARLARIIHAGAHGLLEGGFHTPNHRWAIASALAACGRMFGEAALSQAAQVYLNEGIDCSPDGEYAERSAGNYNTVNNDAMLLLADALDDPAYEQHVIRNLHMMLTYWEPDDSIFTANSTRFDKDRLVYPQAYYIEYLAMGVKYQIPEFLAMANRIMEIVHRRELPAPDVLIDLMLHPQWVQAEYPHSAAPERYSACYEASGVVRVRRGHYTYTVMRGRSTFLWVHNGSIRLGVKIGGSFCEHRAFIAETMTQRDDGVHLHQTMRGWYYLPFEQPPQTSDWWQMDHASRAKKPGPDMEIDVIVRETDDGLEVELQTSGVAGAPWRVELAFTGITRIANEHLSLPVRGDEVLVLRDSFFEVMNDDAVMRIGPAFGAHHFTEGKEDSEAKTPGAATVCLTDYTPFRHTLTIRP